MRSADALLAERLTKRSVSVLLVVLLAVVPVEAVSVDHVVVLATLPLRFVIFAAVLFALRSDRIGPIGAGRIVLAQGVLMTFGWTLLLDVSPTELAFQTTGFATILSVFALLMAPSDHRRWWSLAVTSLVLGAAATRLLPDDPLLFTQSFTIVVFHGIGVVTLDQYADRADVRGKMASLDPLTGLFNRRPTLSRLSAQVATGSTTSTVASVLVLDLDHFKELNDTLGHEAGDDALCEVAKVLNALLQADDVVCRWGGEEFLILLPGVDGVVAERTAEQCRTAISELGVTVSVGVAELRPGDTVTSWVARADRAMYDAKDRGRDQVIVAPVTAEPANEATTKLGAA